LALLLFKRKIIQVPNTTISAVLLIFFGLILGTVSYSAFRYVSIQAATEWITYGVAFYAVVAGVGRQRGPAEIVAGLTLGCTIVAMRGIAEYVGTMSTDPTWRIFAGWVNPNATAAMLLVGFFCALGLVVSSDRNMAAAWGVAAGLNGVAILLTQSKGGLLALVVSGILLFVLVAVWSSRDGLSRLKPALGRLFAVVAALMIAGIMLQAFARSSSGSSALTRVTGAGATAEQSAGFRANLWKGAIAMTKDRPIGYGIGAYRFESARPGITPQTHLAHNTYLQLAAEASPLAPLLLLAVAALWFYQVFRGANQTPVKQNLLRAGVIAAVVAVGAHSIIDSDLYYYGIGLSTFMLLGVGLLLSVDAVAPENVPVGIRRVAGAGVVLLGILFVFLGMTDVLKGQMRGALMASDRDRAMSIKGPLSSYGGADPEAWSLMAQVATTPEERQQALEAAVELGPSTRNLRALARFQAEQKQLPQAIGSLQKALIRDPNNLLALSQLADFQVTTGDKEAAVKTLRRLLAVEDTPYFQIRALPELVPTETYEARIKLAEDEKGAARLKLLEEAVAGLGRYRESTVPMIKKMTAAGGSFGGETLETMKRKMTLGAEAARELANLQREAGDRNGAEASDKEVAAFEGVVVEASAS
jgi:O-antigen ligase